MSETYRRYNPLLREYVIVCETRLNRPWKGETSAKAADKKVVDLSSNYLAPGAVRANGIQMPDYRSTFVFDNDYPVFSANTTGTVIDAPVVDEDGKGLFVKQKAYGLSRVVCFHPDPLKRLVTMTNDEVFEVFETLAGQVRVEKSRFDWIQMFENKGEMVGCSNPHPHCQIWFTNFLPSIPAKKHDSQLEYYKKNQSVMLLDYLTKEQEKMERIVESNEHWTVLVPYWAYWPFETMLIPNRHVLRFDELTKEELKSLAEITRSFLTKYDNVFHCDFPFLMGWHGAPTGKYLGENNNHWQLHASYWPPLVRSETVRKFMGGYEMFAELQRDITPEKAAEILRTQPAKHYTI
uniref:Galactose-1-phosphate uridylyltransferase n=1 Tax=Panagrellus redivivus TaxID=6233 RepID=A0A7E4UW44_PANRE